MKLQQFSLLFALVITVSYISSLSEAKRPADGMHRYRHRAAIQDSPKFESAHASSSASSSSNEASSSPTPSKTMSSKGSTTKEDDKSSKPKSSTSKSVSSSKSKSQSKSKSKSKEPVKQFGTNLCNSTLPFADDSLCQNLVLNSLDDFCLWGPPTPGSTIGETEREEVAYCTRSGYGSRLIPENAITGAHFIQTDEYVQLTGVGDLSGLNIATDDGGGELDPHGYDNRGNPVGGMVFSNIFTGEYEQLSEWILYIGNSTFCFRACRDGPNAEKLCNHLYDELGCPWVMGGTYDTSFDTCQADVAQPMGIYVEGNTTSTFSQGEASTPAAHPLPSSSDCTLYTALPTQSSLGDLPIDIVLGHLDSDKDSD